jgi:hypothetical protein
MTPENYLQRPFEDIFDDLHLMVSRETCSSATTSDGDAAAAAAISASRVGKWRVVPGDPEEVMRVQRYICCVEFQLTSDKPFFTDQ